MVLKGIQFDPDKVFFTSDTHFHHANILDFCKRPWGDVRTHDLALIQNWNRVVPKDGIVFHLGDFVMTSNIDWTKELLSKLNGTIYLTPGNHDYHNRMDRDSVKFLFGGRFHDIIEIEIGGRRLQMCHYPLMFWRRDCYHLHGHVHSGPNSEASEKVPDHYKRYDVGVDNNNYIPVSFKELDEIFLRKGAANLGLDYNEIR